MVFYIEIINKFNTLSDNGYMIEDQIISPFQTLHSSVMRKSCLAKGSIIYSEPI